MRVREGGAWELVRQIKAELQTAGEATQQLRESGEWSTESNLIYSRIHQFIHQFINAFINSSIHHQFVNKLQTVEETTGQLRMSGEWPL
jgi:hypothetical protein